MTEYYCNICGWKGEQFNPMGQRDNAKCPECVSLERHRAFVEFLRQKDFYGKQGGKCLEIAPPYQAYQSIMKEKFDYVTADLTSELATHKMDITDLKFADEEFDVIICFHVLEHIRDDHKAILELRRCLKSDGLALINVPFFDVAHTVEFDKPDPERHMHIRDYGIDVIFRLIKAGFDVEVIEALKYITKEMDEKCRMAGSLTLFVCRK